MLRAACVLATLFSATPALHAQSPAAATHAAQAPGIKAGTYELAITFGGGVIPGSLTIAYLRDSLTAAVIVGEHESPVKPGAQKGNTLVLEGTSPAVKIRYELAFRGDSVTGTFVYEGQSGLVAGQRASARK
jgi:hypothetical protein